MTEPDHPKDCRNRPHQTRGRSPESVFLRRNRWT